MYRLYKVRSLMKGNELQKKVLILFSTLSISILLCFAFFYVTVLNNLVDTNRDYVEQVSTSIIATMENTFYNLEHTAITFTNNDEVKALLLEEDPLTYHDMAEDLIEDLNVVYQADGLVNDIIIYDMDGQYYRFRGTLGNASCDRISVLLSQTTYNHLELELTTDNYIAYVSDIYDEDTQIGYLVFLIQTSKLIELFENYDQADSIQVALLANGHVIASSTPDMDNLDISALEDTAEVYSTKQISYTDFEIVVATKNGFISQTRNNFMFLMMIAIIVFLAIFFVFYYLLNTRFFKPMISVIDNVKEITYDEREHRLTLTGEADFDKLIHEINSMLEQLDDNAQTMLNMQYQTQNALIEKQQLDIEFLKKQINVHFVVNTIAAIKRLSETGDNEKAGDMCNSLAHILRYANNSQDYISAIEELHILEMYIDIMKMKYSHSITCLYEIDSDTDELLIPRMILQPLIENAMVHGVALVEQGTIIIKMQVTEDELLITIQDNGVGMDSVSLAKIHNQLKLAQHQRFSEKGIEHIALINIQRRIAFTFGDHFGLTIDSIKKEGTTVRLNLPLLYVED